MDERARRPVGPAGSAGARSQRLALWGNFGSGNLGNEATLQALSANARRFLPSAEMVVVCSVPEDTRARHALPATEISGTRGRPAKGASSRMGRLCGRLARESLGWCRASAAAAKLRALIVAGTGVLSDDGEGAFGLPHDLFKWSITARAAGAVTCLASVGVERLDHPLSRFFVRCAVRLADHVSFRDEQSKQAILRLGCGQAALVYPDLAFSLPAACLPAWSPSGARRARVAVGIYDAFGRGSRDPAGYRSYLEKMAEFVAALLRRGHDVRLILGDMVYDAPVLADLHATLGARSCGPGTLRDEPARSVEELLLQLAGVDLVVATRFHNLLLGFLLGHPALSIAYQAKNDALMAAMGLGHCCQAIAELDVERLLRQFSCLEATAAGLRPRILVRAAQYRADLDRQYRLLFPPGPGYARSW